MKKAIMLFAEGFEEVEALTVVDLLRRAEIDCEMTSVSGDETVTGSHGIGVCMQSSLEQLSVEEYDAVILPGGMPGTKNLANNERVLALLRAFRDAGKLTAAICAAPTVLSKAKILDGRRAVCYPGMENQLDGALAGSGPVETDGTIITSRGVGTAISFALAIVSYFCGAQKASELAKAIVYQEKA